MAVSLQEFLLALLLALLFAFAMTRMRVLTKGGAMMAGLIGLSVITGKGWWWLLPLLFFLGSGVLLGRLNRTARTDAKHGKPRDAMQVFCSGGTYALLAHLSLWPSSEAFMSVSICVATCDTWASEVGMYARWHTWNILTFRKVQPGLSGGVSVAGLLGGLLGAALMALLCWWLIGRNAGEGIGMLLVLAPMHLYIVGCFTLAGAAGMLLDSALGAALQVKYDDGQGPSDVGTDRSGGLRWITNDMVNLMSNAVIIIAIALLW
ncbi:MAG: DUF92 domain-containing protein [Flavobacteriales bacterium]